MLPVDGEPKPVTIKRPGKLMVENPEYGDGWLQCHGCSRFPPGCGNPARLSPLLDHVVNDSVDGHEVLDQLQRIAFKSLQIKVNPALHQRLRSIVQAEIRPITPGPLKPCPEIRGKLTRLDVMA